MAFPKPARMVYPASGIHKISLNEIDLFGFENAFIIIYSLAPP